MGSVYIPVLNSGKQSVLKCQPILLIQENNQCWCLPILLIQGNNQCWCLPILLIRGKQSVLVSNHSINSGKQSVLIIFDSTDYFVHTLMVRGDHFFSPPTPPGPFWRPKQSFRSVLTQFLTWQEPHYSETILLACTVTWIKTSYLLPK